MTNRIHDNQSPTTSGNAASIEEMILRNVEEIQKSVQGLNHRVVDVQDCLNSSTDKLNRLDQRLNILDEQISQSKTQFNTLHDEFHGIDQRLTDFDKRFHFVAGKFSGLAQQIDHLDTEFGSLKTLVLAAVDKAMKEYSNFVVEKLSLGSTIDTLRLEVDKLKAKIQRLEEAM